MDFIVGLIIVLVVGSAIGYIIKAKKSGVKCIGCSAGSTCSGHCSGEGTVCSCGSGCHCHDNETK